MSRAAQNKAEKAIIDAKVAKVRECVHNVSNNDIVLALHNFDMDEDRTIAAFMDGGVENALGTWEKRGNVPNKKKNRSNTATVLMPTATAPTNYVAISTTATTDAPQPTNVAAAAVSGGARSRKQQQQTAAPQTKTEVSVTKTSTKKTTAAAAENGAGVNFGHLSADARRPEYERLQREHEEKALQARSALDAANAQKTDAFATLNAALASRERQFDAYISDARRQISARVAARAPKQPSVEELARLAADNVALDTLIAQTHAIHVAGALKAIEKLGAGFLTAGIDAAHLPPTSTTATAPSSHSNGTRAPPPTSVSSNGVATQQQPPPSSQSQQQQHEQKSPQHIDAPAAPVAQAEFSSIIAPPSKQNGAAVASAATNGKPAAAKNGISAAKALADADFKHSVSQSSLISSVGDDSGLGQVSPTADQDKNATPTTESGLLSSDGLSAETMAKLNAQIQQQFAAMNINIDMITGSGVEGANAATRRRNGPGGHRVPKNVGNGGVSKDAGSNKQQNAKAVKSER